MSTLTIYGTVASRTFRTLWMANELGLDYEHVPIDFRDGGTRTEDYLRINPGGRIPSIQDGDFTLWESIAINFYLVKRHPGPLTPVTVEAEAQALKWSIWALLDLESNIVAILRNRFMLPEHQRDEAVAVHGEAALPEPLAILEDALSASEWLLGDAISVADINVAAILSTARRIEYDLSGFPAVDAWLDRCLSRPAAAAAREAA